MTKVTHLSGFLRLPQVLALIPISKSVWWEGCKTGRFPKPIKLSPRTTVWLADDIEQFIKGFSRNHDEETPKQ